MLTFKAGNFLFSRKYDRKKLAPLLARAQAIYDSVASLPILPEWSSRLETDILRRSIHGTAAIEGNPLAEERVGELLAQASPRDLLERSEREILNLKAAYEVLTGPTGAETQALPVTEAYIRELNKKITRGLDSEEHSPGRYRDQRVKVGDKAHGGIYTPPKAKADIVRLMAEYVKWLNSAEMLAEPTELRAALAHYHLGLIHPFGDGNGRAARLLEAAILTYSGMRYAPKMLSNFYYRNIDAYFIAFRAAERSRSGDLTPFLEFVLSGLLQSVEELQLNVHFFICILAFQAMADALRQSRDITQRQHDLLRILIKNPSRSVTLKDLLTDPLFAPLYRRSSEQTARRDLKRLAGLKLLAKDETGHRLNPRGLDQQP
ncbi:MAG: Fic family protein [Thermodesulfobacteriota bacterium]